MLDVIRQDFFKKNFIFSHLKTYSTNLHLLKVLFSQHELIFSVLLNKNVFDAKNDTN